MEEALGVISIQILKYLPIVMLNADADADADAVDDHNQNENDIDDDLTDLPSS